MSKVNNKTKGELIEELEALRQHVAELEGSENKCERTGGGLQSDCQELFDAQHDLRERIKELTCLHNVTRLVTKTGISLDKVFNNVVNIIKAAWQYPEIVCARIIFDGKEFKTDNFKSTEWRQSSDIKLNGETIGALEVYYLGEKPELDEGPFLKEERAILEDVARELGNFVKRKQMDEEIKESEERYRALLELDAEVGEAVIMLQDTDKAEAVHTYVSDRWTQITGFSREELLGRSFFDFIHTKYLKASIERHRRKMAGENIPGLFELLIIRKDGTEVPIELTSAYTTCKGKRANVAYISDISERKRIEQALRESEERYRTIFENTGTATAIVEEDTTFYLVNTEFEKLSGYSKEEIEGKKSWTEFTIKDELDRLREYHRLRRIDPNAAPRHYETQIIDREGKIKDVLVVVDMIPETKRHVVSILDITERKQAEEALRESEGRLVAICNSIPDIIIVLDEDGRYIDIITGKKGLLYKEKDKIIGLLLHDILPKNVADAGLKIIQRVIKTGKTQTMEYQLTVPAGEKWFDGRVSPMLLTGGKQKLFVMVTRDITDRKQSEQKLREYRDHLEEQVEKRTKEIANANEQLQAQIEQRIEFTRALVHELKTPLTPLLGASDILVDKLQDEGLRRIAKNINRGANNLNNRINDLINLAKGEMGLLEIHCRPIDLLQILREIADYTKPTADRKKQVITLDLPASLPTAYADEDRLRQVVLNLLDNALKFTPAKGEINIKAETKDDSLIVHITDTGCGIAKKDQEWLFESYRAIKEPKEQLSGLGIGLPLSNMLVELHGGKIWVESRKGIGSTFSFSIPIKANK